MVNTPAPTSIVPTSNYGDSIILDVALSKYCDLIPIERYVQMSFRNGLEDLPAQSLIGLTHHLANYLLPVYEKIKMEVLSSKVVLADETTHKMLEGDETCNWYLWGFLNETACYFEPHDTRSGNVAFEFLKNSQAEYLVSDGYIGYDSAVKEIKKQFNKEIIEVNCNAHAYRYFEDASITWKEECQDFLKLYKDIYKLEEERKEQQDKLSSMEQLEFRKKMVPHFVELKSTCEKKKLSAMPKSSLIIFCR